ncbi:Glycosyltransferase involved in cell wall bisynthesis [Bhargavaea ginsengi]|uniref:Glycosyltransferase involved in cell wall bisynthesis n=1 Tax=Bhargavaea ginsengi TaxID=426757 RepID=A0A1H7CB16_9BACL|nr:glycosyltransferase [Bhargavaea ginsengi]SEJ86838.1 Glycosyltransferase involved in cell wall bisynthesis [Bhargavaea ginsengi]
MTKKILFISDHGDPLAKLGGKQSGGQNNYVRQLAEALAERGLRVDVATHWSDPGTPQIERFGGSCRVIRIAAGRKEFVPKSDMLDLLPAFYKEMKSIMDLDTYDIIHTHYWLSGLLGLMIRDEYGTRIVHTSHSLGIAKAKATGQVEKARLRAEKEILGRADRVIATTPTEKEMILDFAGIRSSVSVVSIGVDRSFERPFSAAKGESPLFVYAGRFEQTKGILTLLRAFRIFLRHGRDARLILAGGAAEDIHPQSGLPLKARLRAAVAGMEDRVTFLGPLSQHGLADLFCRATAVIVPSYYESFGMVAAEAQACGTPVIASEVGGLQDVVQDGRTGLLVSAKNPAELARGMRRIASNPEFADRLGRQALNRARKAFNWQEIAADIHDIYEVLYRAEDPVFAGD